MTVAAMDVGTHAVKMLVARVEAGRIAESLAERRVATRLGEGVHATGRLCPAAVLRTCAALAEMAAAARALGADRLLAVATSAARDASNAHELVEAARQRAGVALRILPGDEEARLSFLGVATGMDDPRAPLTVFDLGGGSTEWTCGRNGRLERRFSLPLGAVRLTDSHLPGNPPSPGDVEAARAAIRAVLAGVPLPPNSPLVGTGGTLHTMAAVYAAHAGLPWERAACLPRAEVERQIALLPGLPDAHRRRVTGVDPDRADILLAGALVVGEALAHGGRDALRVSRRGLRHGLALEVANTAP